MDPEEFDSEPEDEEKLALLSRLQREEEQTDKIRKHRYARELILTPEVASALAQGWTVKEIASVLGVSVQAIYQHKKSVEMQVLLERESRRLAGHLATRNLGKERYRDLALALGVLIDKTRLLRNEPTEIYGGDQGAVGRLEALLYGQGGGGTSQKIIDVTPDHGAGILPDLLAETEAEGPEVPSGDHGGSVEPGSVGELGGVQPACEDKG